MSSSSFFPSSPSTSTSSHLLALKSQISKRNRQMLIDAESDIRPHVRQERRGSLLHLHQQQIELMNAHSLNPFSCAEEGKDDHVERENPLQHLREKEREKDDRNIRKLSHAKSSINTLARQTHLRTHRHQSPSQQAINPLQPQKTFLTETTDIGHLRLTSKLTNLLTQIRTSFQNNEAEEQISNEQTQQSEAELLQWTENIYSSTKQAFRSGPFYMPSYVLPSMHLSSTLKRSQALIPAMSLHSPHSSSVLNSIPASSAFLPKASTTPRQAFAHQRMKKFNDSVKVMIALSPANMESIRQAILRLGGGVSRPQFLAVASRIKETDERYAREIEALQEMFNEIDVNGDGDLQYGELTSYLVELANGRYDHHHIDQLLHTKYHSLETVMSNDHIDITGIKYHPKLRLFTLFEKSQHRFKILDSSMKPVQVIRGHQGVLLDAEYLPLHRIIVTSSSDRTLRFWNVEDNENEPQSGCPQQAKSQHRESLNVSKKRSTTKDLYQNKWRGLKQSKTVEKDINKDGMSFQCVSTWPLPSSQMCLCWYKTRLYSGDILGRLLVWNIDAGEVKTSVQAHDGMITALITLPDKGFLCSASVDGLVKLWELQDMKPVHSYSHKGSVRSLSYDQSRGLLFSGGDDDSVIAWSCKQVDIAHSWSFRTLQKDKGARKTKSLVLPQLHPIDRGEDSHNDSIIGVVVSGNECLSISQYGLLRIIDCDTLIVEQTLVLPKVCAESTALDRNQDAAEGNDIEKCQNSTNRSRELVTSWTIVKAQPAAADLSHLATENIFIASAGAALYPFTRNKAVNKSVADHRPVTAALFNPVNFTIVTAAHRSIKTWDAITGRLLKEFHNVTARHCPITSTCLDARGRKLIVASADGSVSIFNCNTGAKMQSLANHDAEVQNLVYIDQTNSRILNDEGELDPNKILCCCHSGVHIHCDDHEASLNKSNYSSLYHSSLEHRADITSLIYSPSSQLIISTSMDSTLIMYPTNLDGTALLKHTLPSPATIARFIEPFNLLLLADMHSHLHAFAYSQEELVQLGELDMRHKSIVTDMRFETRTCSLYTADDSGNLRSWALGPSIIEPYINWRESMIELRLSRIVPTAENVAEFFHVEPNFSNSTCKLLIAAHHGSCNMIDIIPGREPSWSDNLMHLKTNQDMEVSLAEKEDEERIAESYDVAILATARILYDVQVHGSKTGRSCMEENDDRHSISSKMGMSSLKKALNHSSLQQLEKESRRLQRQLHNEHVSKFQALRREVEESHQARLNALNLSQGSPTSLVSCGEDGRVRLWSVEGGMLLGELHQGEVATLGMPTPQQWQFYVNMSIREQADAAELAKSIQQLHEVRDECIQATQYQGDTKTERRASEEQKEQTSVLTDQDRHPNGELPTTTATTNIEQKRLLEAEIIINKRLDELASFSAKQHAHKLGIAQQRELVVDQSVAMRSQALNLNLEQQLNESSLWLNSDFRRRALK